MRFALKIVLAIIAMTGYAFSSNLKSFSQSAVEQPDIFFNETIHNFGKVYKNENIEHLFVFQNRGVKDLKIVEIKSSCGCIATETSNQIVSPSTEGFINVQFTGDRNTGHVTKRINVYSNDPDTPVYILKLTGEIVEDITIKPKHISFGHVPYGEEVTAVVEIQPRPGFGLEIKDVISNNPAISISYKKDETKNKYIVEVTLKEDILVGVYTGNILIFSNSERQSREAISFFGEVSGDIRLYPAQLNFGVIKKGGECTRSVFFTLQKEKVEIEKVDDISGFLITKIIKESKNDSITNKRDIDLRSDFWKVDTSLTKENRETQKHIRILAKIKKDVPMGRNTGVLKVHTNSKIQPIINIPVSVVIVN